MASLQTPKGREMHPLSGDPDTLAGEVTRMKNVASTIEKLTGMLDRVHSSKTSQSQKVDQIRDAAGQAKDALAKAKEIYNNTGWALDDYRKQLATSVTNAKTAYDNAVAILPHVNAAEHAHSAAVTANAQLSATASTDTTPMTPEQTAAHTTKVQNAANELTTATNDLAGKQATLLGYAKQWDTAKDDLDTAAETARGRIRSAIDKNPAKDSWWDDFASFLSALTSILGWVALVLTIVAIFLTGPLALAFLAIATAITLVNLIAHTALAATGKGTWADVAFDAIGLIPFGKFFGRGLSIADRFGNVGKGILENANVVQKFRDVSRLPALLDAAVSRNALSRSGRLWQSWADNASRIVDASSENAPWYNAWKSMQAGGSAHFAQMADVLENLPGRNGPAREAIETALESIGGKPSLATGTNASVLLAAGAGWQGHGVATGGDWTVNQVVNLFSHDPSASDLKSRILTPSLAVPATPIADPYR